MCKFYIHKETDVLDYKFVDLWFITESKSRVYRIKRLGNGYYFRKHKHLTSKPINSRSRRLKIFHF